MVTTSTPASAAARTGASTNATRWAGLAGLLFAVSVAVENIWAGAAGLFPDPDAGADEIVEKFAEHGNEFGVLFGWVALTAIVLLGFLAGAWTRLRDADPVWARMGVIGALLVAAFFPLSNVPLVALSIGGEDLAGEPALVNALWQTHLATFAFTGLVLGVGLTGLSLAAVAAGLMPRWFRIVGPLGGLLLVAGAVPVKANAEGSPATMIGGIGFIVWLVFLAWFGVRMWREA